jgi:hypothetical protein
MSMTDEDRQYMRRKNVTIEPDLETESSAREISWNFRFPVVASDASDVEDS